VNQKFTILPGGVTVSHGKLLSHVWIFNTGNRDKVPLHGSKIHCTETNSQVSMKLDEEWKKSWLNCGTDFSFPLAS
jgi:hypothetical protein